MMDWRRRPGLIDTIAYLICTLQLELAPVIAEKLTTSMQKVFL